MSYFSIEIPCACPWGGAGEERQVIWGGAGSFDARRDAEAFAANLPTRLPWRVIHNYWDSEEGRMVSALNGQHGDIPRLATPSWIKENWGIDPSTWPTRGAVGDCPLIRRRADDSARPVEFELMERLNAVPKRPGAPRPFAPIEFREDESGRWWALDPNKGWAGFGYWYASLAEAVSHWLVDIREHREASSSWIGYPSLAGTER